MCYFYSNLYFIYNFQIKFQKDPDDDTSLDTGQGMSTSAPNTTHISIDSDEVIHRSDDPH